jgi:hypothetical protein
MNGPGIAGSVLVGFKNQLRDILRRRASARMQTLADAPDQLDGLRHVGAEPVGDRDRLLAPSPTTLMRSVASSSSRNPARTRLWLSASSTLTAGESAAFEAGRRGLMVENGDLGRAVCRVHGASLLDEPVSPANPSGRVSRTATVFVWLTEAVQW